LQYDFYILKIVVLYYNSFFKKNQGGNERFIDFFVAVQQKSNKIVKFAKTSNIFLPFFQKGLYFL